MVLEGGWVVLRSTLCTGTGSRDGPSEGFVGFLVLPSAPPSLFSLNSHSTLCQCICQRDSSACQALLHRLPHCDGDHHRQVRFFGMISSALDGRGDLPLPGHCWWDLFRGICCSDLEGMEHWEVSLGMLPQCCSSFLSASSCRSSWKLSLWSTPWRRVKWKLPLSRKSRSWEWEFKSKPPKCTRAGCGQFGSTDEGKPPSLWRCELTFPFLVTKFWLIFLENGDSSSLAPLLV